MPRQSGPAPGGGGNRRAVPAMNRSATAAMVAALAVVAGGLAALAAFGGATPAGAVARDLQAARAHYPDIVGSAIDNCALCHVAENNYRLDPYGYDWHENDDDFDIIEGMDSDGDGFTNLEEIVAFTYPGKPDSRPGPTATEPSATATATATTTSTATLEASATPTTGTTPHVTEAPTASGTAESTPSEEPAARTLYLPSAARRG